MPIPLIEGQNVAEGIPAGMFAIPQLPMPIHLNRLIGVQLASIRRMGSTLINVGFPDVFEFHLPNLLPNNLPDDFLSILENHIIAQIVGFKESYLNEIGQIEGDDFEIHEGLHKIFCAIHLWGGQTGRNIFIRDGGLNHNLDFANYKVFVGQVLIARNAYELFKAGKCLIEMANHLGTSFVSKHIHFWSAVLQEPLKLIPIYDQVIAKNTMGRNTPNLRHMYYYWHGMIAEATMANTSTHILERELFNFFSSNEAIVLWNRQGG